jgi:hypothetical protein
LSYASGLSFIEESIVHALGVIMLIALLVAFFIAAMGVLGFKKATLVYLTTAFVILWVTGASYLISY